LIYMISRYFLTINRTVHLTAVIRCSDFVDRQNCCGVESCTCTNSNAASFRKLVHHQNQFQLQLRILALVIRFIVWVRLWLNMTSRSGSASAAAVLATKKTATRKRTSTAEYLHMVEFVEIEDNFKMLTDGAAKGKPMQSGQKLTKTDGYKALAEWMNKKLKDPARIWTEKEGKSRWEAYMVKYKNAFEQINSQTGFGLTVKDEKMGICTIAEKADRLCPYYDRLNSLFGHRQNIRPSVIVEAGAPNLPEGLQTTPSSQIFEFGNLLSQQHQQQQQQMPESQVFHFDTMGIQQEIGNLLSQQQQQQQQQMPESQAFHFDTMGIQHEIFDDAEPERWAIDDENEHTEILASGLVPALPSRQFSTSQESTLDDQRPADPQDSDGGDDTASDAETSPVDRDATGRPSQFTPTARKRPAKAITTAQPKFQRSTPASKERTKPGNKIAIVSTFAESLSENNKLEEEKVKKKLEYRNKMLRLEQDKLEQSKVETKAKMVADLLKAQVPWEKTFKKQ